MPAQRDRTRMIGVEVMPREAYLDRQSEFVAAIDVALGSGRWDPASVPAMPPRCTPVHEDAAGNRFVASAPANGELQGRQRRLTEATAKVQQTADLSSREKDDEWGGRFFAAVRKAAEERSAALSPLASDRAPTRLPFQTGRVIDVLARGGFDGGFLSNQAAPPLPMGGSGVDWMSQHLARLPRHVELGERQDDWARASGALDERVGARTDPLTDEWRQAYFRGIREAAAKRDPTYQSATSQPRGPGFFRSHEHWAADDFRQRTFASLRSQGERVVASLRHLAASLLTGQFAPRPAGHDGMAEFLAKLRTFGMLGDLLMHQAMPRVKALGPELFKALLADKAQAVEGQGHGVSQLMKALDIIKQLNASGVTSLLAALADQALFPFEPLTKGCLEPNNIDMGVVMDGFASKLTGFGLDKGIDALIGQVTDQSPLLRQVAAHYKDQLKSLAKQLLSAKDRAELKKKLDELFNGAKSSANVRIGLAHPRGGANMVLYNGMPATRLHDICEMPWSPDVGEYKMGNPKVITNGQPTTGEIHVAQGNKGTIATPAELSPNVLMGAATVSLRIKEHFATSTSGAPAAASSGPSARSGGGSGSPGPTGAPATHGARGPAVSRLPSGQGSGSPAADGGAANAGSTDADPAPGAEADSGSSSESASSSASRSPAHGSAGPTAAQPGNPDLYDGAHNPTTDGEMKNVIKNPLDAVSAQGARDDATAAAEASGLPGAHGGAQDAFRHCEASCDLSNRIGSEEAEKFGTAHENSTPNPNVEADNQMDLHNNARGREIADAGLPCIPTCRDAVDDGTLRTVAPDGSLRHSSDTDETTLNPDGTLKH